MGTESGKAPTDAGRSSARPAAHRPAWRRALEVIVPVAVIAVAAPFAVNGLANAINAVGSDPKPAAEAATVDIAGTDTVGADTTVIPATTATTATTVGTAVPVTVAGVDAGADDQTIALATEIVSETTAAPDPSATATTATAAGHAHGGTTPEIALTRAERVELGDQLALARAAALRYPTVADALAGGYVKVVGYVPLIGSHYIKWSSMDGTFDVNDPEMLLYDGTDPTSHIVGLSYYVFSDTEPSPFVGQNDHWHQHIGLCIKDGVVVGGEQLSAADCAARGGTKANAGNGWMVHAWVVPGWDSPQGVFSPEHVGLTPDLPTS